MLTPVSLLVGFLVALLSLLLPVVGIALVYKAMHPPVRRVQTTRVDGKDRPFAREIPAETRVVGWQERWRDPAVWAPMAAGLLLLFLPFWGRSLVQARYPVGGEEPVPLHGEIHDLKRSDGTTIHAEVFGPVNAPTLVLTHGWSTDNTEWFYAKRQLAGPFRIIVWDLPGLGETMSPADDDFSLERMATDLHTVLTLANGKPVVIVGHSIGGMINLTFCKMYPQDLKTRVAGLVALDSSYTIGGCFPFTSHPKLRSCSGLLSLARLRCRWFIPTYNVVAATIPRAIVLVGSRVYLTDHVTLEFACFPSAGCSCCS